MLEIRDADQARKLVLGATVLGTGGGGNPSRGFKALMDVLESGRIVRILPLEELPEDSMIAVPYFLGSLAPGTRPTKALKVGEPMEKAIRLFEEYIGTEITAFIPAELGGGNTPTALRAAAEAGLPAIDGDLVGRAAPQIHQSTALLHDVPMHPAVIVSGTGNAVIISEYADVDDYEAIARYVSILSGRSVAVIDTPMNLTEAKKVVIRGTLSLSYRLGERIIEAREAGRDPIQAILETLPAWKVFEGVVKKYLWRNEEGFLKGEVYVAGLGEFKGRELKSWIMNEHIMVWLDDEPLVMPPDIFILVKEDGEPVTNMDLKEGIKVVGIAAKAPQVWRCPKGLQLFGPKRFGFSYEYVPVENLVKCALGVRT
ncbi:MAG: DUF917 domain-containing protein [Desulfurococcales archaeon]|nr:DUF917 domain-containing protein [Desulfurococcales archaeon]